MEEEKKCPLCGNPSAKALAITDNKFEPTTLCEGCDAKRFYLDDEREIIYRNEVEKRITKLKEIFSKDYDETLHRGMVEQMVRCEISIERYDQLISNDNEAPQTAELLKAERNHWNKLADKLNMTIAKIRGDMALIQHDLSDDFKEHLAKFLGVEGGKKSEAEEEEEDNNK